MIYRALIEVTIPADSDEEAASIAEGLTHDYARVAALYEGETGRVVEFALDERQVRCGECGNRIAV